MKHSCLTNIQENENSRIISQAINNKEFTIHGL
jgi:hypothetical protein